MPNPVFITLPSGNGMDSKKFSVKLLDNTMSQEIEGGYELTRPRTTRRSRKLFNTGFTYITEADRLALEAFFQLVGNSKIFDWTSPQDGVLYRVRFKGELDFKYVGRLSNQRWDCDFQLKQA